MNIIPGQAKATSCKKLNTSWIEKLSSFWTVDTSNDCIYSINVASLFGLVYGV